MRKSHKKTQLGRDAARYREMGLSYGKGRALEFESNGRKPTESHAVEVTEPADDETKKWKSRGFGVELFVRMYNEGYSDMEIAKEMCVPYQAVQKRRKLKTCAEANDHRSGEPLIPPKRPIELELALKQINPVKKPTDVRAVLESYNTSGTVKEAAEKAGTTRCRVQKLLERCKLPSPSVSGGRAKNPNYRPLTDDEIEALVERWQG